MPELTEHETVVYNKDRPDKWGLFVGYVGFDDEQAEFVTQYGLSYFFSVKSVRIRKSQKFSFRSSKHGTPFIPSKRQIKWRASVIRDYNEQNILTVLQRMTAGANSKMYIDWMLAAERQCTGCRKVFLSSNPRTNHYCPSCTKKIDSARSLPEYRSDRQRRTKSISET
jgi:predicted RNA-binding Zn-ribbon protein involved in translation (DUF1610 family)